MDTQQSQEEALTYHPSKVSWVTAEFIRHPPAWTARAFIYMLVLSIVLMVAYASVAKVAIHVDARGALVTEQGILPVRVPVTIKVAKLSARENQAVKKGDVLIVTQDQLSPKDFERLTAEVAQIRDLLKDRASSCKDCTKRLTKLAANALTVSGVPALEETLAPARELLQQLASAVISLEQVDALTASARRQISINSEKIAEVKRRKAEALLGQQLEQLTSEIVAARNQIAERKQSAEGAVEQAQLKLDVRLTGLLSALEIYRSQQDIVAPIAGIVTRLKVSGQGQLISAGTEILQIIPGDSQLIAELAVANKDISQIRVDMPVIVRLDALPERQYGTVNGKIETVPVSISSAADSAAPPTYSVVVRLDRQALTKHGVEYPFRIGMQLEGLIVTRHESMLANAVRKLLSISDDMGS